MSMMEPFLPHPHREETIAAADAGAGAPEPAPGFGVEGEDPDTSPSWAQDDERAATGTVTPPDDVPFRTPDPGEVGRTEP